MDIVFAKDEVAMRTNAMAEVVWPRHLHHTHCVRAEMVRGQ